MSRETKEQSMSNDENTGVVDVCPREMTTELGDLPNREFQCHDNQPTNQRSLLKLLMSKCQRKWWEKQRVAANACGERPP